MAQFERNCSHEERGSEDARSHGASILESREQIITTLTAPRMSVSPLRERTSTDAPRTALTERWDCTVTIPVRSGRRCVRECTRQSRCAQYTFTDNSSPGAKRGPRGQLESVRRNRAQRSVGAASTVEGASRRQRLLHRSEFGGCLFATTHDRGRCSVG